MARALLLSILAAVACLPESVHSVTLTPTSPEVETVLLAADARWEAAGVAADRIVIGPGGSPVSYVPERAPVSETRVIGRGSAYAGVRWIELADLTIDTAVHEMGHALGINVVALDGEDHVRGGGCEGNTRAVMCAHVGNAITVDDLDLACSVGACSHFTPE